MEKITTVGSTLYVCVIIRYYVKYSYVLNEARQKYFVVGKCVQVMANQNFQFGYQLNVLADVVMLTSVLSTISTVLTYIASGTKRMSELGDKISMLGSRNIWRQRKTRIAGSQNESGIFWVHIKTYLKGRTLSTQRVYLSV